METTSPKPPPASRLFQFAILLIRFTLNFNEAVLTAEISQTFFKFMGVTLLSSTIIWFIPLLLYVLLSPLYTRVFLKEHPRLHFRVLTSLLGLLVCNTFAFSHLHYLETLAANQLSSHQLNLLAGIFSFTIIDMSKMVFDWSLFQFVTQRVPTATKPAFHRAELLVGEVAKIIGGVVSCLYVLQQKTFSGRFSELFYTNIQFCYFFAGILNALTAGFAFACWPKETVLPGQLKLPIAGPTFLSAAFPGLKILASLRKSNQLLAVRKFFIVGLYYCVVLTLTQWVSDAFTDRYSHSFLSNSMQVLDVGTSWGSVSLSIYFCINAVQTIASRMWGARVAGRSRILSGCFAFVGGATLLGTFALYDQDIKVMVLLLGLSALGHDVFLNDRISESWEADPALATFRGFERRKRLEDLEIFVEVLAYTAFVFLFPVLFFAIDDKYWILATGVIYLGLFFWKPKFEEAQEAPPPPIGYATP